MENEKNVQDHAPTLFEGKDAEVMSIAYDLLQLMRKRNSTPETIRTATIIALQLYAPEAQTLPFFPTWNLQGKEFPS